MISGARPLSLRRVNYYEDFQFRGLFDPHPDHPLVEPKELIVDTQEVKDEDICMVFKALQLSTQWNVRVSQIVAAGETAALVRSASGTVKAAIRAPRSGTITAIPGQNEDGRLPKGPLFTMLYFEDGSEPQNPFAEVEQFIKSVRIPFGKSERELKASISKMRLWIGIATAVAAFLSDRATGSLQGPGIIVGIALVVYYLLVMPKEKALRHAQGRMLQLSERAESAYISAPGRVRDRGNDPAGP